MKLNAPTARFVLEDAFAISKMGPIADFPKTEIVIGPVVVPNGTTVVIVVGVALMTRLGIPLNWTAVF